MLQGIFAVDPTLAIADIGDRWTEMLGSAEYLRLLTSFDERRAKEMKEEKNTTDEVTVSSDDGDEEDRVEAGSESEKMKKRECWFFRC